MPALYKAYGETVNQRKSDDITVSIVRKKKPKGLFTYFKEHGIEVINSYAGIYYIQGLVLFPTQIIVTKYENSLLQRFRDGILYDRKSKKKIFRRCTLSSQADEAIAWKVKRSEMSLLFLRRANIIELREEDGGILLGKFKI